ncbi:phosphatidylinositol 3,4,5-trisphosphate 5-phosphatase 2 isoform X2 [Micractinium conductrix]|uniref:Phosphatidylinositol 3,4,5-trisphosphate 5-phosphatase 2 isoform X2 n=1 Tax=Micractinium conductrix TaxID=554055 RepID=A0A2P6UZ05_9CHLO|nr:phosphatidylinositol 3,4,5-trisphosphate 5-phosphatase 2 isoform X2 [Micractinium conductrix]|eukprot:PSC67034.1 phosphatidylinositol 3,4,5-trisphosphate 5-phosphatase 2 isoform X2 [Micractinium conductrix]
MQQTLAQMQQTLAQVLAGLAQVLAGQAQMQAQLDNVRRRAQNSHARNDRMGAAPLAPLCKERPPPAGAAGAGAAAVGTLPPPGIFPASWAAVDQLNNAQFDALAALYGENFGPNGEKWCAL